MQYDVCLCGSNATWPSTGQGVGRGSYIPLFSLLLLLFFPQLFGPRLLLFFVVCATFVIVFRCLGCSCCFFVVSAFFSLFRLLLFYDLRPIWCLKMLHKKKDTSCSFWHGKIWICNNVCVISLISMSMAKAILGWKREKAFTKCNKECILYWLFVDEKHFVSFWRKFDLSVDPSVKAFINWPTHTMQWSDDRWTWICKYFPSFHIHHQTIAGLASLPPSSKYTI